jgi:hypothetical protein
MHLVHTVSGTTSNTVKTTRVQSIDVTKACKAEEMTRDEAFAVHTALLKSPEYQRLWCQETDLTLSIAERRANFDKDDSRGVAFDVQRRSTTLLENTRSAMRRIVLRKYSGMTSKRHKKQEEVMLRQSDAAATVLVWLNNYDFSDKTTMTYDDALRDYWPFCPTGRKNFDQLLSDAVASTLLNKTCLTFIPGSVSLECAPGPTKKRTSGAKKAPPASQTKKSSSKKGKNEKEAKPKFDPEYFETLKGEFEKDAYLRTLEQRGHKHYLWADYIKTGRFDPFYHFFFKVFLKNFFF